MSRKHIFELLAENYDLDQEAKNIELLLSGIEQSVNRNYFIEWKYRRTAINTADLRNKLRINTIVIANGNLNLQTFLRYVEYTINIIHIHDRYNSIDYAEHKKAITENTVILLNHLNFECYLIDEDDSKIIIIEKNPSATAVAEIIEDERTKIDIIEYNHFLLKGDLDKKRKILSQLYKEFEKIRPNIKEKVKINSKHTLDSNLGELFNNTDIRHYKGTNPVMQANFKKLSDTEKEEWYDKIYDLFLTSILANSYVEMKNDIDLLKKEHI